MIKLNIIIEVQDPWNDYFNPSHNEVEGVY